MCSVTSTWRCPRVVSTVLCVHERLCQPEDCNQHGTCVDGQCVCSHGWAGPTCTDLSCQSQSCGEHGLCTEGEQCQRKNRLEMIINQLMFLHLTMSNQFKLQSLQINCRQIVRIIQNCQVHVCPSNRSEYFFGRKFTS